MDEKDVAPDVTSGTPEIVLAFAEHVIAFCTDVTVSATSAGRTVLPTTKHAAAWRELRKVVGMAVVSAKSERMVRVWECIVARSRFENDYELEELFA